MQEEEIEKQIIHMAEKFYKKPDEFINEVQELFALTHNEKANFFFSVGLTLIDFSYFNLSLHSSKYALKYCMENNDRCRESDCYISLGDAYNNLGDYTKAIEYHEKALKIKEEIGDKRGESACYINLGNAYLSLADYTKGIEYQEKALDIATKTGDKVPQSQVYGRGGTSKPSAIAHVITY